MRSAPKKTKAQINMGLRFLREIALVNKKQLSHDCGYYEIYSYFTLDPNFSLGFFLLQLGIS